MNSITIPLSGFGRVFDLTLGGHAYRLCEPGEYRDVVFDTVSF
jgi:hypothetical protein